MSRCTASRGGSGKLGWAVTDARPNERGGLAATVQPTHLDRPSRHILSTAFLQSEATSSAFYILLVCFHCFH